MKTFRILSSFILTTALLASCDWHTTRTVIGSGPVESEIRPAGDFTGVSVTGQCNVDISIGDSFYVELFAQAQVLDVMTTEVRNDILNIGFNPDYNVNTDEEISATIVLPSVNFVGLSGAGGFALSGEKQARLDIQISGAGDVQAFNLPVDQCYIGISGTGNCEVHVMETLQVVISGVGNIFYKGSPDVTSDISGVGNVVAAGR